MLMLRHAASRSQLGHHLIHGAAVGVCSPSDAGTNFDPRIFLFHNMLIAALMERDARTYPSLVFVEVDSHHFSLAHSHQIINENWVGFVIRPDNHHSDFRLGFRAFRRRNNCRPRFVISVSETGGIPRSDSVQAKSTRVFCFAGSISSRTTFSGRESASMVLRKSLR